MPNLYQRVWTPRRPRPFRARFRADKSQGPVRAAVLADDATVGTVAWSNPGNAGVSDDTYATCVLLAAQNSHYLKLTDFRMNINSGVAIAGVLVEVEAKEASALSEGLSARLVVGGVVQTGTTKTATLTTSDVYYSMGGATDTWGLSLTPAQVNASDFGVALFISNAVADTVSVDHVRITVFYAIPVIAMPSPIALAAGLFAPLPRVRGLPAVVALSDSMQSPIPRVRTLPSLVQVVDALQVSKAIVRSLPSVVSLVDPLQIPRPVLRAMPPVVAEALVFPSPTLRIRALPQVVPMVYSLQASRPAIRLIPSAISGSLVTRTSVPAIGAKAQLVAMISALLTQTSRVRSLAQAVSLADSIQNARPAVRALPTLVQLVLSPRAAAFAIGADVPSVAVLLAAQSASPRLRTTQSVVQLATLVPAIAPADRVLPAVVGLSMSSQDARPILTALPPSAPVVASIGVLRPADRVHPSAVSLLLAVFDPYIQSGGAPIGHPGVVSLTLSPFDPLPELLVTAASEPNGLSVPAPRPSLRASADPAELVVSPRQPVSASSPIVGAVSLVTIADDVYLTLIAHPGLPPLALLARDPVVFAGIIVPFAHFLLKYRSLLLEASDRSLELETRDRSLTLVVSDRS